MFCSTCGVALSQQLKYCNRCGAQLTTTKGADKSPQKRLDDYLDGLFWMSVLGLGVIIGGMIALKKLNLADWLVVIFVVLSSIIFLINIGLSLPPRTISELEEGPVGELSSTSAQAVEAATSVTENTTRELESIPRRKMVP